jgi:hypothetical protein
MERMRWNQWSTGTFIGQQRKYNFFYLSPSISRQCQPNVTVEWLLTTAFYSVGPVVKSRQRNRISWMRFFEVFLIPSRQNLACYLKLSQDHLHPHFFQFIIHRSFYHSSLYILSHDQRFNPLKPKLVFIICNNSVRTAKKTQLFTITKINWLMLFKEVIPVYTENHMKHVNTK